VVHFAPEPAGDLHRFHLGAEPVEKTPRTAFSMPRSTLSSRPMVLLLSPRLRGSFRSVSSRAVLFTGVRCARIQQSLLHQILLGRPVNDLNPQRPGAAKSSASYPLQRGVGPVVCCSAGFYWSLVAGAKEWLRGPIGVFPPMSVMLDLAAFTGLRIRETGRNSVKEVAREWRNGRRAGFRCQYPKGCGGSNPPSRTQMIEPRSVDRGSSV
jgi:hypothetical protein